MENERKDQEIESLKSILNQLLETVDGELQPRISVVNDSVTKKLELKQISAQKDEDKENRKHETEPSQPICDENVERNEIEPEQENDRSVALHLEFTGMKTTSTANGDHSSSKSNFTVSKETLQSRYDTETLKMNLLRIIESKKVNRPLID